MKLKELLLGAAMMASIDGAVAQDLPQNLPTFGKNEYVQGLKHHKYIDLDKEKENILEYNFSSLDFNGNGQIGDAMDKKTAGNLSAILEKHGHLIMDESRELNEAAKAVGKEKEGKILATNLKNPERIEEMQKSMNAVVGTAKLDGSYPYLENAISQINSEPQLQRMFVKAAGAKDLSWNALANMTKNSLSGEGLIKNTILEKARDEGGIPKDIKAAIEKGDGHYPKPDYFKGTNIKVATAPGIVR